MRAVIGESLLASYIPRYTNIPDMDVSQIQIGMYGAL